jgi:hypothetical protein
MSEERLLVHFAERWVDAFFPAHADACVWEQGMPAGDTGGVEIAHHTAATTVKQGALSPAVWLCIGMLCVLLP